MARAQRASEKFPPTSGALGEAIESRSPSALPIHALKLPYRQEEKPI
jgi:hypothetical protein